MMKWLPGVIGLVLGGTIVWSVMTFTIVSRQDLSELQEAKSKNLEYQVKIDELTRKAVEATKEVNSLKTN